MLAHQKILSAKLYTVPITSQTIKVYVHEHKLSVSTMIPSS